MTKHILLSLAWPPTAQRLPFLCLLAHNGLACIQRVQAGSSLALSNRTSYAAALCARPPARQVVMRRGGREDRSRELLIPVSASMAHHLKEKEEREAAEKAELKRLVLEAEKRELLEARAELQQQQGGAGRGHHSQRGRSRGGGGYYHRGGGFFGGGRH
jgi:hypothetical protein